MQEPLMPKNMPATVDSDGYERFVQSVLQDLEESGKPVFHKKEYRGRISGRKIIVDVSYEDTIFGGAKLLVLIECKCYAKAVEVGDVDEFFGKLHDIGANKGIMVTTVGYQEGAIKTAKGHKIALARLSKEPEERQITFVVNAEGKKKKEPNENFWQGNLRGPSDSYEVGWRFESMPHFLSILFRDENQEAFAAPYKKALEDMERVKKQKFNPAGGIELQ
jgi:hypothetical protein